MTEALISVGLPVFNAESTIRAAVESLLAQDVASMELVISDNGSTDQTPAICQEYARRDPRVRFYRSETNRGGAWNFSRALELSSGEFFMWAGSHDRWLPGCVRACRAALDADPEVALAYTRPRWVNARGEVYDPGIEPIDTRGMSPAVRVRTIVRDLKKGDMVYGLFRSSVLRKCRVGLTCPGGDHVLLMEVSVHGAIAAVPEPGFLRAEPRRMASTAEYIAIQLMRIDPQARHRRNIRRYWELGFEHLKGVWAAKIPLAQRGGLAVVVAATYVRRYRRELRHEVLHPLFPRGIEAEVACPDW